ncbi:hypothetical protein [Methylogaea oryzae]|nr:hypothetical protein [Methylogaea oryzae]
MAKSGLRAAGYGTPDGPAFSPALLDAFHQADVWIHGAFALEQGAIFTSTILAAVTVAVIERRFLQAAAWCGVAALLSSLGLMHSYLWTPADTALSLTPAWPWAQAYALMGLVFFAARWVTVADDAAADGHR